MTINSVNNKYYNQILDNFNGKSKERRNFVLGRFINFVKTKLLAFLHLLFYLFLKLY